MTYDLDHSTNSTPQVPGEPQKMVNRVSFLTIMLTFFHLGATTYGGMWAATQKLEEELVEQKHWLDSDELRSLLVTAALIPAPKFIGLGGLIGFRLRGWLGSAIAAFSLIAPGALMVLLGVILVSPTLLEGPLEPLRRAVGIAVVGLLLGNAYHQLKSAKVKGQIRMIGIGLGILVAAITIAGVPLLLSALLGFTVGAFLIKAQKEEAE